MARQRVPEGPPAIPPVQKLRIRYAKRGRLRFSSTRDFQRALERALRRSGVPMAYSAGFHPHPKISYTNAAPTGTASEAEYAEIAVVERVDPERVAEALDAALPPGLDVLEVVEATGGALADALEASLWRVEFSGLSEGEVQGAVTAFLKSSEALVTRTFKKGPRTFDVRGAVLDVEVAEASEGEGPRLASDGGAGVVTDPCAILQMVVRHTTPAVRPDDVLTALRTDAALDPPAPPLVTRIAQGRLVEAPARVADPLVADQAAVGVRPVTRLTRAERA